MWLSRFTSWSCQKAGNPGELHGQLAGQQCLTSAWWAQTRAISCSAPSAALSDASCAAVMFDGRSTLADRVRAALQLPSTCLQLTGWEPDRYCRPTAASLQLHSGRP